MDHSSPTRSSVLTPRGVTWAGVAANSLLAAGKIVAGVFCASQTILADGLHSASDLVTDAAVLAGLRLSDRPADRDHHYGHRRVSTLVAMLIGAALLGMAAWIGSKALIELHRPHAYSRVRPDLPLLLALVSIPIKEVLYQVTRHVGRRTDNMSLLANAWHHRTDALTSVAAAAGLAGVLFGGAGWAFLDHLTAMVLSAFLVVAAGRIIASSASELIDRAPAAAKLACIRQAVADTRGVRSFHAFRARQVGGKVAMDIHIQVDPSLTVGEGHEIASAVRRSVMHADRTVIEAIVHIEPAEAPQSGSGLA